MNRLKENVIRTIHKVRWKDVLIIAVRLKKMSLGQSIK